MSARSAKATCTRYAADIVKARGQCERCGITDAYFEAAHIIKRDRVGDPDGLSLRTNPVNHWCLCVPCHREVDTNAVEFGDLVMRTIGREKYAELVHAKNAPHRPWRESDWVRERARLLAILKAAA